MNIIVKLLNPLALRLWDTKIYHHKFFNEHIFALDSINEYRMRSYCPVACETVRYSIKLSQVPFVHDPPKGIEENSLDRLYKRKQLQKEHILVKMSRELSKEDLEEFIE